jgi:hypothetical protein
MGDCGNDAFWWLDAGREKQLCPRMCPRSLTSDRDGLHLTHIYAPSRNRGLTGGSEETLVEVRMRVVNVHRGTAHSQGTFSPHCSV